MSLKKNKKISYLKVCLIISVLLVKFYVTATCCSSFCLLSFFSIRAICGENLQRNCVHGSDSTKSAAREISFFFKEANRGPTVDHCFNSYNAVYVVSSVLFLGLLLTLMMIYGHTHNIRNIGQYIGEMTNGANRSCIFSYWNMSNRSLLKVFWMLGWVFLLWHLKPCYFLFKYLLLWEGIVILMNM